MEAYRNLATSYDRLTNDVDYSLILDFYWDISAAVLSYNIIVGFCPRLQ